MFKLFQDNNEGDWENTVAILGSNPECCGTEEERYVSPSESDNSDYRRFAEPLPNANPSVVEDMISSPASSSAHGKNKWASTSEANATFSDPVRGKLKLIFQLILAEFVKLHYY
jgi:hypothetical protein